MKRCIQEVKDKEISYQYFSKSDQEILLQYFYENNHWYYAMLYVALYTGMQDWRSWWITVEGYRF